MAEDNAMVAMADRVIELERALRMAKEALCYVQLKAPGYDWNADPLSLTLLTGDADRAINMALGGEDDRPLIRMSRVLWEVGGERRRQDAKWGGPEHDDNHPRALWEELIEDRVAIAHTAGNRAPDDWRKRMIQVAALAIAAIEADDRYQTVRKGALRG